eukprot:3526074-Prymnesium_polylepis.1
MGAPAFERDGGSGTDPGCWFSRFPSRGRRELVEIAFVGVLCCPPGGFRRPPRLPPGIVKGGESFIPARVAYGV